MSFNLQQQQEQLTQYIRNPDISPVPENIETRRLKIYSDLFFNSIEGLLASNFPVIRQILSDEHWLALVRDFYSNYSCHTPLFTEIGQEFIAYLQEREDSENNNGENKFPLWLAELAHYEWIELALQINNETPPKHLKEGDLLSHCLVLSPNIRVLAYQFPVHQLSPEYCPDNPPATPTLLLAQLNNKGQVDFSIITVAIYRLIELIETYPDAIGKELLAYFAKEAQIEFTKEWLQIMQAQLQLLIQQDIILGIRV